MRRNTDRENELLRPLQNVNCPYCGAVLDDGATKEHLVARRFVPKGSLENSRNIILRACSGCNVHKSDLEDDLSAISMGVHLLPMDSSVLANGEKKLKGSLSRRTKKPLALSSETTEVTSSFGPQVTIKATFVAPPQPDEERVFELARMQLMGLFFALTYDSQTRRGGFWPGVFAPMLFTMRQDWGHPRHVWFMKKVNHWEQRIAGYFADGYFKFVIRRNTELEVWAWALEWNRNFRVVGFFGNQNGIEEMTADAPDVVMQHHGGMRFRLEVPLTEADDCLFPVTRQFESEDGA